jgi:hypothetical protein
MIICTDLSEPDFVSFFPSRQTTFNGSYRKFSEHMLKSGMFRDNGFNTSIEKSKITGHETIPMFQDRINFNYAYDSGNGPRN